VRQRNTDWLAPWEATDPSGRPTPTTYGSMIRAYNRDGAAAVSYPWAIFFQDDHENKSQLVGQLIAAPVLWGAMRSTTLGYWIDSDRDGPNIDTTAVALGCDYLLTRVGLHRIEINYVPGKRASLRVVKNLGMRTEGIREDYTHINGRWRDDESYAITASEPP